MRDLNSDFAAGNCSNSNYPIFSISLVPSKPPPNVTGNNLTSTSIEVRWNPIPPRFIHGVLLGYKVSYTAADLGNNRMWNESVVNQNTTSAVITNLHKFTKYMVSVEGFTSKGSGIESKCVEIKTAEDSENNMMVFVIDMMSGIRIS